MPTRVIEISSSDDVIDVRDITERVEELEEKVAEGDYDGDATDAEELQRLVDLLEELKGNGGDHDWRGDWYPITLIRDSYFEDYARELADDIGAVNKDLSWPNSCIDWEQAASQLQQDYSTVEFESIAFWYR